MGYNIMIILNIVIIIDIFILVLAGIFFQYMFKNRLNKAVGYATNSLSNLLDESADISNLVVQDKDMIAFYEKLIEVASALRIRENNRKEVLNIANSIAVNMELSTLLEDLLPKIIKATNSCCAAFYMANHSTNKLEIKSSVGFSKNIYGDFDLTIGEGLIGSATKDITIMNDIPDDSIFIIKTYLGKMKPKSIMIIPIIDREQLVGTLSLASIYNYRDDQNEIIELIRYYVGISIGNAITYEQTKRLTNELRFQNTLIQNLNEDLEKKVDNRTVFLNNIIDSILDYAIYALDNNYNITAWNRGAEQILGYTKDEVMGRNVEIVTVKSDVKNNKLQTKIESAIREGRYEESGWRLKKDGTNYYSQSLLFPMYDAEKNIIGFTNVIKDITYIKNVERALGYEKEFTQKIFEASQQAVIVTNQRGMIEMANHKSEELLGECPLIGVDLCGFFLESDYLRRNLVDVALRYGKGEWKAVLKKERKSLLFSVYVLMESGVGEPKLFLYLME